VDTETDGRARTSHQFLLLQRLRSDCGY